MAGDRLSRKAALTFAANIVVREIADARLFAAVCRNAGSTKLADAIEAKLAEVKKRDIGGHDPHPDPAFWGRAGR
jgi:hypothetical protein